MNKNSDNLEKEMTRRELLQRLSPLGKVEVEGANCTGCGLCVRDCPTGALSILPGADDSFSLVFQHGRCTACGACTEICPEKCLRLERELDTSNLEKQAVLLEDTIVRCAKCRKPFATRGMIEKVQARLPNGKDFKIRFELCPACRIGSQIGQETFNRV